MEENSINTNEQLTNQDQTLNSNTKIDKESSNEQLQKSQIASNANLRSEDKYVKTEEGLKVSQKYDGKRKSFKYKIQDKKGKITDGLLDADTKAETISYLQHEGYKVLKIEEVNQVLNMDIFGGKLNYSELAFLLTQLSTYLKAGIPLMESVRILERQTEKMAKKRVFSNIIYELSKGETFSNSLIAQGNTFPPLLINMVKTAELTGDLPEILDDMRDYYESMDRTRKEAISSMIYPSILFVFAIGVLVFILTWVIPSFVKLFEQQNAQLPLITKIVLGASDFLVTKKYWILGIVFALIIVIALLYMNVKSFRKAIQTVLMKLPGFGKIIIYREVTMFTKTFASLLNHNVFITDSMEILRSVSNNEIFKEIINSSLEHLSKGAKISDAFEDKWAFPIVAYEMLVTGENTGRLPMMMTYVANYYDTLHTNLVKRINTFIEPLLIIFIAIIVGIVVISVIVPMFGFYETVL